MLQCGKIETWEPGKGWVPGKGSPDEFVSATWKDGSD